MCPLESLQEAGGDLLFFLASLLWLFPHSGLAWYRDELGKTLVLPPISRILNVYNAIEGPQEIRAILDRAHRSRAMLIACNLRYVKWFAYKFRRSGLDYEDAIQEGNIGLMKAVDKFDLRRHARLKTFALWWIRQSITRAISDNSRVIRLPVHVSDNLQRLKRVYRSHRLVAKEEPSLAALASATGLRAENVKALMKLCKAPMALEVMNACEECLVEYIDSNDMSCRTRFQCCDYRMQFHLDRDDGLIVERELPPCMDRSLAVEINTPPEAADLLYRVFSDKEETDQLDRLSIVLIGEVLDSALNNLGPRQRKVLELRYGFGDTEPNTLQEVADKMGVTRERIRQIESAGLDKLLSQLRHNHLFRRGAEFAL